MLSELDIQLQAIMDRLTAPGAPFELGRIDRFGAQLPVFRNAPPALPALFDHYCAEHRDKEFLVDGQVRLTFGEVHTAARRSARGLVEHGMVERGDRVAIAGANSAHWIVAYMAVLMAGGCATLLNSWSTGDELAEAIRQVGCKLVLADPERRERLGDRVPGLRVIDLCARPIPEVVARTEHDEAPGLPELTGDDIATILFTSGSTGASKAAFSDHRAVIHAAMNFAVQGLMIATQLDGAGKPRAENEVALLTVPLFHATGAIAVLLKSFFAGRKLVIMGKWEAREAMRLIEAEGVTFFTGVPLMCHEIASHPDRDQYDLTSCTYLAAGGAAQPAAHVRKIRDSMNHAFALQGYGLTETNSAGCTNFTTNYLDKPESTGPASKPLNEIAILGPEGDALPAGMAGEVAVRSICNFRGYWNDPEATAMTIRPDGFFLTGDLGRMDEEGYLYIIDRKKDIIIRGGENIAAVEVERALYSHPGIAEASVFGLPDEHYGEVPVAVYHAKAGERLDARELQQHLAERIAAFKIPVQLWEQHQALPRLAAQKVDKRALRDRYARVWVGGRR